MVALSRKLISKMWPAMLTAKECLQSAEVCLALAHKIKELDTRAALLAFTYEFRTVAKLLQHEERKLSPSPPQLGPESGKWDPLLCAVGESSSKK
jgi:hypothetical protein